MPPWHISHCFTREHYSFSDVEKSRVQGHEVEGLEADLLSSACFQRPHSATSMAACHCPSESHKPSWSRGTGEAKYTQVVPLPRTKVADAKVVTRSETD